MRLSTVVSVTVAVAVALAMCALARADDEVASALGISRNKLARLLRG